MNRSIFIYLPANNLAGAQKVAADLAYSFDRRGFEVAIGYPIIPYIRVFLNLKDYLGLVRSCVKYLFAYLQNRSFALSEILEDTEVKIHKFWFRPHESLLMKYDEIIILGEYLLKEIKNPIILRKSTLYIFHPLEIIHKNPEYLRPLLFHFLKYSRKILSLSEFTRNWLKENININTEILIPCLSRYYFPILSSSPEKEFDILIYYIPTTNKGMDIAEFFMENIQLNFPKIKVGVLLFSAMKGNSKNLFSLKYPKFTFFQNISEKEMPQFYRRFKLFLYPSRFEGFGIPPLEALSNFTIPIIHENVGGFNYYSNKDNSIYINKKNISESFEYCINLINDQKKINDYIRSIKRTDFQKFSPERFSKNFEIQIKKLI